MLANWRSVTMICQNSFETCMVVASLVSCLSLKVVWFTLEPLTKQSQLIGMIILNGASRAVQRLEQSSVIDGLLLSTKHNRLMYILFEYDLLNFYLTSCKPDYIGKDPFRFFWVKHFPSRINHAASNKHRPIIACYRGINVE